MDMRVLTRKKVTIDFPVIFFTSQNPIVTGKI